MWKLILLWIVELVFIDNVSSLKDVVLTIEPKTVQRFSNATLRCSYDLEGQSLYSVKWYRGILEFYRYTPSEQPNTKVFSTSEITVDERNSNSTQVMLRDIEFPLSGNFSCEVTTDEPFSTGTDAKTMLVVQLPENPPKISVSRKPLDYGDILRANCSSSPSRPRASLTFLLNNLTVAETEPLTPRQAQELAWSDLILELELSEFHFSSGRLILQCVAQVEDIYREEAVLKLDSCRDPVPQKVSAYNGASFISSRISVLLIFIISTLLFHS